MNFGWVDEIKTIPKIGGQHDIIRRVGTKREWETLLKVGRSKVYITLKNYYT